LRDVDREKKKGNGLEQEILQREGEERGVNLLKIRKSRKSVYSRSNSRKGGVGAGRQLT